MNLAWELQTRWNRMWSSNVTLGTVTSIAPLTVTIGASSFAALKLAHYTPVNGDVCELIKVGDRWVAQGKIG